VFDGVGKVLERADRDGLLGRILRRRVRFGEVWNDDLDVALCAQRARLQQRLVVVDASPVHVHTYAAPHNTLLQLLLQQPFNGLFSRTTRVSRYQKGKTSLDLNEARDDGVWGCSCISWTICKQSAPRSNQITTPTPHHYFYRPDALPEGWWRGTVVERRSLAGELSVLRSTCS